MYVTCIIYHLDIYLPTPSNLITHSWNRSQQLAHQIPVRVRLVQAGNECTRETGVSGSDSVTDLNGWVSELVKSPVLCFAEIAVYVP